MSTKHWLTQWIYCEMVMKLLFYPCYVQKYVYIYIYCETLYAFPYHKTVSSYCTLTNEQAVWMYESTCCNDNNMACDCRCTYYWLVLSNVGVSCLESCHTLISTVAIQGKIGWYLRYYYFSKILEVCIVMLLLCENTSYSVINAFMSF